MEKHEHTSYTLAEEMGTPYKTVWSWRTGESTPSLESLAILVNHLECNPQDLMAIERGQETLSDLRNIALLSSLDVANFLDVSRSTYNALERGQLRLSSERSAMLAIAFSVDRVNVERAWRKSRKQWNNQQKNR